MVMVNLYGKGMKSVYLYFYYRDYIFRVKGIKNFWVFVWILKCELIFFLFLFNLFELIVLFWIMDVY